MHFLGADPSAFPPIDDADEDGIIAVGGDLSAERLVQAYRRGIFPWYSAGLPILWHCPDPRFCIEIGELHVPRSLRRTMSRGRFEIRLDTAFDEVTANCARVARPGQSGTWITSDMRTAYRRLFDLGLAHSSETFRDGQLVGGLYGVSLGEVFFGESMFALEPDASKVAFVTLVEWMAGWGVKLVDCQQQTAHLARFGAKALPRAEFLTRIATLVAEPTRQGRWSLTK